MQITKGTIPSAKKTLIYGPEGVGKSTLAAMFPDPLFIDVEGSTKHMDVKRLPAPESWRMLMEEVAFVRQNPDICKTLVVDTADWAERLCIAHVCASHQWNGIEDPGYGKGYVYLAEEFGNLLNLLSEIVERGINVVFTAHAFIHKFEQPDEMSAYDRWELKLGKKSAPLVKEWADMVLFANYKTFAVKNESKTAKAQGGKHMLYTAHTPAWDAKNRYGLPTEIEIEGITALPPALTETLTEDLGVVPQEKSVEKLITEDLGAEIIGHKPAEDAPKAVQETLDHVNQVHVAGGHLAALEQLMTTAEVTEEDVRAVVARKGYFPAATPLDKYPAEFVEGVLIGAWPQVLEAIKEFDDVPF